MPALKGLYASLLAPGACLEIAVPVIEDQICGTVFQKEGAWYHAPTFVQGLYLVVTESISNFNGAGLRHSLTQIFDLPPPPRPLEVIQTQSVTIRLTTDLCAVNRNCGNLITFGGQIICFKCKVRTRIDPSCGSVSAEPVQAGSVQASDVSYEFSGDISGKYQHILTLFMQRVTALLEVIGEQCSECS